MPAAVASRYARALVDAALSPTATADPGRIIEQLRTFEQALAGSPELGNVLASPAVTLGRKRAVIDRLATAMELAPLTRNFLKVLIDHRRAGSLSEILEAFEKVMDDRMGVLRVKIASARELTGPQQESLTQGLAAATGKQVWLDTKVDEALIGGVVARIGSTVYDGSVNGKLQALGRAMGGV